MAVGIGRRQFISALGSAVLAWPLTARAQQPAVARRIAILSDFSELEMQPLIATFREQLQQGWEDDSIRIDTRLGITGAAQFQGAAAALVGMAPDVIVTLGSPSLRAMKQETRTIPIVFTFVADPVGQGLVASLAHPGGNATVDQFVWQIVPANRSCPGTYKLREPICEIVNSGMALRVVSICSGVRPIAKYIARL